MKIVRTIAEMRELHRGKVGLVPTMGAFHEGHLSLMRSARPQCEVLVCSLFVNPTQFGPGEDYMRYPRDEERDAQMASDTGVDILFAPSADEMYRDRLTTVSVKGVSELWDGVSRPGHFDGVATVVCKLFNIVQPSIALFGLKDLQQCAVVAKMVEDLNLPVELQFCPTYREQDGLAMSSRNVYLSAEERLIAAGIYRELNSSAELLSEGARPRTVLEAADKHLTEQGFKVEYFALVDTSTMRPLEEMQGGASLITAARLGKTRLIDNVQLANRG